MFEKVSDICPRIELKIGTLSEVISGAGREVYNDEELYNSRNNSDLHFGNKFVPHFIGVFQNIIPKNLEKFFGEDTLKGIIGKKKEYLEEYRGAFIKNGLKMELPPNLISLVYDDEETPWLSEEIQKIYRKDFLKRINYLPYQNVRDHSFQYIEKKYPFLGIQQRSELIRIARGAVEVINEASEPDDLLEIGCYLEEFSSFEKKYVKEKTLFGLTREEEFVMRESSNLKSPISRILERREIILQEQNKMQIILPKKFQYGSN